MDQSIASSPESRLRTAQRAQPTRRVQQTQSTPRLPAQREPVSQPDIFSEEFDDIWPTRTSSSVMRYRSDVQTGSGRSIADVQEIEEGERRIPSRARNPHAIPPRRSAQSGSASHPSHVSHPTTLAVSQREQVDAGERVAPMIRTTEDLPLTGTNVHHSGPHWVTYAGLGMLVMILGWFIVSAAINWCQVTQDDLRYGRPRTYQIDQVVGHNDSRANPSHFIAINLNRHVEVIEFPGGDATHAKVYIGPVLVGPGQDLAAVTLTFKDLNSDQKPDMIINVQDSHIVFINDNGQFRAQRPGEIIVHP